MSINPWNGPPSLALAQISPEILAPVAFFVTVIVIIAIRTAGQVIRSLARERTRREIAAFIAEGSMTPEQGERLLKAGLSSKDA